MMIHFWNLFHEVTKVQRDFFFWEQSTFERRDSWDSNMCNSSELSISSSMPVIFPARLACMDWISGKRRSPVGVKKKRKKKKEINNILKHIIRS